MTRATFDDDTITAVARRMAADARQIMGGDSPDPDIVDPLAQTSSGRCTAAMMDLRRGLVNHLITVLGSANLANPDRLEVVHELTRPEWLNDPAAASTHLRTIVDRLTGVKRGDPIAVYAKALTLFDDAADVLREEAGEAAA